MFEIDDKNKEKFNKGKVSYKIKIICRGGSLFVFCRKKYDKIFLVLLFVYGWFQHR